MACQNTLSPCRLTAAFLLLIAATIATVGVTTAGPKFVYMDGTEPLPPGTTIETVIPAMNEPVGLAFDPEGRLFYNEKSSGNVRLFAGGLLQTAPVINFDVDSCSERGLLGIALDPNFSTNRYIYVYYTAESNCGSTENRVVRFVENGGAGSDPTVIFRSPQTAGNHDGGNIHFGLDGKLYVTIGDNANAGTAQNLQSKNGKIHRINPDGTDPGDNPYPAPALGSLFAHGLRNSFDFVIDPLTPLNTSGYPRLFATENGPNCDDEMNRIEGGYNYGWRSSYPCGDTNPTYNTIPSLWSLPTGSCCEAPTGITVYTHTQISQWTGGLFMASHNTGVLRHFYLNGDRTQVTAVNVVEGVTARGDLLAGPDGAFYYVEGSSYSSSAPLKRIVGSGGPACATFSDVSQTNTFYPYIACLACRGIIGGYGDGTFRPNNDVTRGQIAKIVSESAGYIEDPGAQRYQDVPSADTFYAWINRLSMRGHMGGYPCGGQGEPCSTQNMPYFRPNSNATRGQLSKIVSSAAGYAEPPSGQTFEDVSPSNTFYAPIERLASRGIMGGYPCGGPSEPCGAGNRPYFRWASNVTRGQASKIVSNTFFPGCNP